MEYFSNEEIYEGGTDMTYKSILDNIAWEPSYNIRDNITGGISNNNDDDEFSDYIVCVMSNK